MSARPWGSKLTLFWRCLFKSCLWTLMAGLTLIATQIIMSAAHRPWSSAMTEMGPALGVMFVILMLHNLYTSWWLQTLNSAIHSFHNRERENLLQLNSLNRLKQEMALKSLQRVEGSTVLAVEFLAGLSRSANYTPKQRVLLQGTSRELQRLREIYLSLFSNQSDLLTAEDFKVVSMRDVIKAVEVHFPGRIDVEEKLFGLAQVALSTQMFNVCLEQLLATHLQHHGDRLKITIEELRGSLVHHDLETEWTYCHLQIKHSFTLLQDKWYLRWFRRKLNLNWQEHMNFQVDAGLSFLRDVCQWHGGLLWTDWSSQHELTIHIALPCSPTGREGFAA